MRAKESKKTHYARMDIAYVPRDKIKSICIKGMRITMKHHAGNKNKRQQRCGKNAKQYKNFQGK